CRSCRIEVTNNNLMKTATAISKAVEDESRSYIIRLCNGNLKIGISSKLGQRATSLHRDTGGPIQVLATTGGGLVLEAQLQTSDKDYRIKNLLGEQFEDVEEIRELAEEIGIDDEGHVALAEYAAYRPTGTAKVERDYVEAA